MSEHVSPVHTVQEWWQIKAYNVAKVHGHRRLEGAIVLVGPDLEVGNKGSLNHQGGCREEGSNRNKLIARDSVDDENGHEASSPA